MDCCRRARAFRIAIGIGIGAGWAFLIGLGVGTGALSGEQAALLCLGSACLAPVVALPLRARR